MNRVGDREGIRPVKNPFSAISKRSSLEIMGDASAGVIYGK